MDTMFADDARDISPADNPAARVRRPLTLVLPDTDRDDEDDDDVRMVGD